MADGRGLEHDRAALIARYDLDAGGFATLDQIAEFASALCDAPIALVSIVEDDRQRFLARTGLDVEETPRSLSFCAHAMLDDGLFVLPDATRDPRFADNILVTGPPYIRFYAGAPLISGDGTPLGALCVVDSLPRNGLTELQLQGLSLLARQVMVELEGRRRDRAVILQQQKDAQRVMESDRMFRTLADTMPQMVWSARPDGHNDYFNARWNEFSGVDLSLLEGDGWANIFHPEDQPRAWAKWRHSLATGEPYEIEYRMRHNSGVYRWALGRALPIRDADGVIVRWIGTCTDINDQILMVEEREVIAHELSHRIKNIFSVIAGLIGLSARQHPEIQTIAADLRDRIMALGRAHDFVRPHGAHTQSVESAGHLRGILEEIFAPYRNASGPRIQCSGDNPAVDDRSATPLALLFHELATNAAKYGALSVPEGHVSIDVQRDQDQISITWQELGGPPVTPAAHDGFGSRLMELSVERQLGGRMARDWRPDGLNLSLWIPAASMIRTPTEKA